MAENKKPVGFVIGSSGFGVEGISLWEYHPLYGFPIDNASGQRALSHLIIKEKETILGRRYQTEVDWRFPQVDFKRNIFPKRRAHYSAVEDAIEHIATTIKMLDLENVAGVKIHQKQEDEKTTLADYNRLFRKHLPVRQIEYSR